MRRAEELKKLIEDDLEAEEEMTIKRQKELIDKTIDKMFEEKKAFSCVEGLQNDLLNYKVRKELTENGWEISKGKNGKLLLRIK